MQNAEAEEWRTNVREAEHQLRLRNIYHCDWLSAPFFYDSQMLGPLPIKAKSLVCFHWHQDLLLIARVTPGQ
jgi:hypothetical protein